MIEMKKAGICCLCHDPATKVINGFRFCAKCGDTVLTEVIGKCIKAIEEADVTVKILPKRDSK